MIILICIAAYAVSFYFGYKLGEHDADRNRRIKEMLEGEEGGEKNNG